MWKFFYLTPNPSPKERGARAGIIINSFKKNYISLLV